jgi:pimeloyl-ACP methyl ester carboxylesterase
MIAGGSGDSGGFTGLVNRLADQYTVVTYDRLGSSRSPLDAPSADMSIERHSTDVRAVLAVLTTEPAYVFGSSAGALIGLDLLVRYPEQVRLLIAHEPTVPGVLPAFDQSQERYLATYRREGVIAELSQLMAENSAASERQPSDVARPPINMQDVATRAEVQFKYTVPAILSYQLDIAALERVSHKIVLAGGSVGQESPVYRCTATLAERLGSVVVAFPGDHIGCVSHPEIFAERLREVLGERAEN